MSYPNLDDYEEQTGRIAANLKTIEETALDLDGLEEQVGHIAANLSIIENADSLDDDYENRHDRVIEKLERRKRLQEETGA